MKGWIGALAFPDTLVLDSKTTCFVALNPNAACVPHMFCQKTEICALPFVPALDPFGTWRTTFYPDQ